jgi:hypothetical protein
VHTAIKTGLAGHTIPKVAIRLLVIATFQALAGMVLIAFPNAVSLVYAEGGCLAASLLYGIARAWKLVGACPTSAVARSAFQSSRAGAE